MTLPLKVGLVGARRAVSTCRGFGACPETVVHAVCDLDEAAVNAAADRYGIPERFTRYEDMLDSGIDIAVIGTPMQFHARMSVAALERDIHVLCEVTAAVSLEECGQLVRAQRRSKAAYMMAENYCYMQPVVLVREMVRQGLFGQVYFGEGEYTHELEGLHFTATGAPTWRHTWQVGRRGCTYPTHSLGPLLEWFDDRVESVTCLGSGRHTPPERRMDDVTVMLCRLSHGQLVSIRNDMISKRPHIMTYYSIQGTKGCYEASRGTGAPHKVWLEGQCDGPEAWRPLSEFEEHLPEFWRNPPEEAVKAGHGGGDYFVVRDFVDAALGQRPAPIDVYRALDYTVPGLVSEESIERGGVSVAVPDFRAWDGVAPLKAL
ncbi:MAG: Gfo/Idh/MocA family oxidoreductase [Armatimonadetes bacterium]|nr:Gfo/Idh/MocA family oxidoreductase [Armatimonadota bacterium]